MNLDCKVTFNSDKVATIEPALATLAGWQGENNAVLVNFIISGLNIAAGIQTKYRVDVVDGAGGIHNGVVMELDNTEAYTSLTVQYHLGREITVAGGRAEIKVVITTFENGLEVNTLMTPPFTAVFGNSRSVGSFGEENNKREINDAVRQAENLLNETKNHAQSVAENAERLVEAANNSQECLEEATEQVKLAKAEVENAKAEVDNAKGQVDLAKAEAIKAEEQAEIAGVHAYDALLKSGEASRSVAEADRLAGEAATYANSARELAEITEIAKSEAVESVTAAANFEAGAKKAQGDAEIAASAAGSSAHDAQIYRDRALDYAETAYSYLDQTKNEAEKVKTIIAEELPVYTPLYKNDTPDWVSHDESSVDPYTFGKDVYFKADIKAGEKYVVRFSMEHQEGHDDIIVLLSTKNSGDSNDRIFEHKFAFYNEVNKCYEVDYTANRNSIKDEELMLFVGYPCSSSGTDFDASFGWVHILHKENLQSIVDNQNIKIAAIGEDIETALDGIITLQENLIGGDTV